jgi:hypothetical protein
MERRPHSLFSHLTLIHITRRLVIVHERDIRSKNRKNIARIKLLIFGIISDIILLTCDTEVNYKIIYKIRLNKKNFFNLNKNKKKVYLK